ncbi:hypothetical protein OSB04_un001758 [Centaurea solstitialis]|uniref:Reverse transcriptase domain-containing protein n=1 Tax=Centaurea solstitialis TaxID=347529 RepID=A0AA38SN74_9ASTR|nr:hypothetical protein OSB04_un001758 [Centaurea solstitialis]
MADPKDDRVSVFARLSKPNLDDRLKIPEGLVSKLNFAEAVGVQKESMSLDFFPLKDKTQSRIDLPLELAQKAAKEYHTTLYGYFLGPRLPFAIVQRYVKVAWGKFGFSDMMMNSNGFYFFKFNDKGGSESVIGSGPLMIRRVPLFVFPWEPNKGITKPLHTTCPLWVKLHNIPLVAFNTEGISRIASALGVPKQMDAVGELKRELEVVVPSLDGGSDVPVTIRVEYLWEPVQCSTCLVFGHKLSSCPNASRVPQQVKNNVDSEGFTRVANEDLNGNDADGTNVVTVDIVDASEVPNVDKLDGNPSSVQQVHVPTPAMVEPSSSSMHSPVSNVVEQVSKAASIPEPPKPPEKPPLKGILKNPNRFAALAAGAGVVESKRGDDGVKNKKDSGSKKLVVDGGGKLKPVVDLMVLESHAQYMHCEVRFRDSQDGFFVSFVYAANRGVDRRLLRSGLRKFKVLMGNKPWLVVRDFNCLLFPHDALGGQSRRNADMMEFAACLEDVELFDVRYMGIHHTWCQKPREEARLRRKLDRILTNTEFTSCFQDATARFLPRGLSDHSPGVITFNALKHELDTVQLAIDLDPSNTDLREDLESYRMAYQQACWNDMSAARQRAKVRWLADGDANTKFFHQVVREKRHSHHIHSVCNSEGNFVYGKEVVVAFIEHFKQIIGTKDDGLDPVMPQDYFTSTVPFVDALHMIRPLDDSEIRDAMFQIGNDKAPAKVIVERMKPYLDGLISNTQSAFIPGRKITDNILMAHELVVGYHLSRGPRRCAFKIDLRKAYDMVNWDYLFGMLEGCGFHPVLIKWIKEMVSTTSFSLCLNGESVGFFKGERGIRQGDPLSPYLFTIVMEGFGMLFKRCIAEAENFGFHHGCSDLQLTHLCFADDLFVFTYGDVASVSILKKALDLFALRSGLAPNLQKSDVFFGNVADNEKTAILNCISFREGSFPIRYLGVPLSPVALKASDYGGIIAKVKERIQNWKSKFLSFGGRKQLIMSVLQSFQLYWMAVFVFPSVVIHDIEACFRDFLWAQGDSSKGKCKVAWALVCRPLDCGGLGFKRLSVWNRAIISRNIWALATNQRSLWANWIKTYVFRGAHLWSAKKSVRWSWLFAKMMAIRGEVKRFISMRVGDGSTTNAWYDQWLRCGSLLELLPYRVFHATALTTSSTVSQLLSAIDGEWPLEWIDRCPVLASVDPPTIVDQQDQVCWDVEVNSGLVFSVKAAYRSFDGLHATISWTNKVWFKGHIPKHSFCLWLASLNRLPTQDRISTWKDEPPDLKCSLCGIGMDSISHLFFECSFANQVWQIVKGQIQWSLAPNDWEMILAGLSDLTSTPTLLIQKLGLAATVYHIWRERNKRLFSHEKIPAIQLAKDII